jgi:hypothetical protein
VRPKVDVHKAARGGRGDDEGDEAGVGKGGGDEVEPLGVGDFFPVDLKDKCWKVAILGGRGNSPKLMNVSTCILPCVLPCVLRTHPQKRMHGSTHTYAVRGVGVCVSDPPPPGAVRPTP